MGYRHEDIYDAPYEEWAQSVPANNGQTKSEWRKKLSNFRPNKKQWIRYVLFTFLTCWVIFNFGFDTPSDSSEVVVGRTVKCWEPKGRNSSNTHMLCDVGLYGAHIQTVWVPKNVLLGQEIKIKKRTRAISSSHLYEYMSHSPNMQLDTGAARRST